MKRILYTIIALTFFSCITSCSHKNDLAGTTNNTTSGTASAGNYRISLFFDNNKDETSNFTGYTFDFAAAGQLKATKGATVITGTWAETNNRFSISFPSGPLNDLNDNWLIESKTATTIFLKEDNPSKTGKLRFTKI